MTTQFSPHPDHLNFCCPRRLTYYWIFRVFLLWLNESPGIALRRFRCWSSCSWRTCLASPRYSYCCWMSWNGCRSPRIGYTAARLVQRSPSIWIWTNQKPVLNHWSLLSVVDPYWVRHCLLSHNSLYLFFILQWRDINRVYHPNPERAIDHVYPPYQLISIDNVYHSYP